MTCTRRELLQKRATVAIEDRDLDRSSHAGGHNTIPRRRPSQTNSIACSPYSEYTPQLYTNVLPIGIDLENAIRLLIRPHREVLKSSRAHLLSSVLTKTSYLPKVVLTYTSKYIQLRRATAPLTYLLCTYKYEKYTYKYDVSM